MSAADQRGVHGVAVADSVGFFARTQ